MPKKKVDGASEFLQNAAFGAAVRELYEKTFVTKPKRRAKRGAGKTAATKTRKTNSGKPAAAASNPTTTKG